MIIATRAIRAISTLLVPAISCGRDLAKSPSHHRFVAFDFTHSFSPLAASAPNLPTQMSFNAYYLAVLVL